MEARAGETGADGFIIRDPLMSVHGIKDNEPSWRTVTVKVWKDKSVCMWCWYRDKDKRETKGFICICSLNSSRAETNIYVQHYVFMNFLIKCLILLSIQCRNKWKILLKFPEASGDIFKLHSYSIVIDIEQRKSCFSHLISCYTVIIWNIAW